ncbi:MAG: hypothetical protein MI784_09210 [Cytophagales bacterium]|nr:hypothetical protein [Cytophagales bacterium]
MFKKHAQHPYRPKPQASIAGTSCIREAMASHRQPQPFFDEVIQRAVGFEIEIGYTPFRNQAHRDEMLRQKVPIRHSKYEAFEKDDLLMKGKGFEIRIDVHTKKQIPYLEIVTIPFDENATGKEKLQETFPILKNMMQKLSIMGNKQDNLSLYSVLNEFGELIPGCEPMRLQTQTGIESGFFQVTAGVDLSRLPALFQDLAWPEQDEEPALAQRRALGRKIFMNWEKEGSEDDIPYLSNAFAFQAINKTLSGIQKNGLPPDVSEKMTGPVPWTDELVGLLSMIAQYLVLARRKINGNPKFFAVLLSRNDFGSLFQRLGTTEKDYFMNNANWFHLLNELIRQLEIGDIDEPVYARGIFHGYGETFASRRYALNAVTRFNWLMEIPGGKDLLTEKYLPVPEMKEFFVSMGEFADRMDTIEADGQKKQVPVFEFRFIKNPIRYDKWEEFALASYHWIKALNTGANQKFGETSV